MAWTWSNVTNATPSLLNNSVREIHSDSTGQYILVNGGQNGVYRSADYGATWSRPSEFSGFYCSASCASYGGAVMYVAMIDTNAFTLSIYYSTNQGASWTVCANQPNLGSNFNIASMCCKSDGTHLVFTTPYQGGPVPVNSTIHYNPSPTTTGSWSVSNINGTVSVACFSVACNPSATYYVAVMPSLNALAGGVYTSTNQGATWTRNSDASITDNAAMWTSVSCSGNGTFIASNSGHWTGMGSPPMTYDGGIFKATNPTGAWSAISAFSNYVGSSFAAGPVACNYDATNIFVSTQPKAQTGLANEGICYTIGAAAGSSVYDSLDGQGYTLGYTLLNTAGTQPLLIGIQYNDNNDFYGLLSTNGGGGAACFLEGTKILTEEGYKPIESLRVGDMVETLKHGYKPIVIMGTSKIYNDGTPNRTREKLYRYPEGLVVTGGHSALVDQITGVQYSKMWKSMNGIFLTEGKIRLPAMDDERASPYPVRGEYTIYNFALESPSQKSNYGVYADGVLTESSFSYWIEKAMHPVPEIMPSATSSASSAISCAGK